MGNNDAFCSRHADVPITVRLDGLPPMTLVRTAGQWAVIVGVKWETVKKRRQRGDTWLSALKPGRRKRTFNSRRW